MSNLQYLNVFKYVIPLSLRNFSQGKIQLKRIINDVLRRRNTSHLMTLPIHPALLEFYNVRYAEKWVKKMDENFLEYHVGSKPSLNIPPFRSPKNIRYLSTKFFSGDVSGMIAESLFIYLLDYVGVNVNLVGHLRPYKRGRTIFFPDFVIWDRIPATTTLISINDYQLPIYAEVKGSTYGMNEQQLEKALHQLNNVILTPQDCGLIFIAYKNPNYEGIIFEVRL